MPFSRKPLSMGKMVISSLALGLLGAFAGGLFVISCGTANPAVNNDVWELLLIALVFSGVGFVYSSAMVGYFFHLLTSDRTLRDLDMADDELFLGEVVLSKTAHRVWHYRTGRSWRVWEEYGGRLFLTNRYLIFKTHGGQLMQYTLPIALNEIARVEPCQIGPLPVFSIGLSITRIDGSKEFFRMCTFGADSTRAWAKKILTQCPASLSKAPPNPGIISAD
jgi:hypothetical protein